MNYSDFASMFDNIPVGLFRSTVDGKFLIVNRAMFEMFGFKNKEEMLKTPVLSIYNSKSDREKIIDDYINSKKVKKRYEILLKKKDKTLFWGKISETMIVDDNGKILYFEGVVEDISEKIQKDDNMQKLATLVKQAAVSIVMTDKKGIIEYVNPCFEKTTGYKIDEVLGKNPRILKSKNAGYSDDFYKKMWETVNGGKVWHGKFTNSKKSGEDYIEEATIFPIISNKNNKILSLGAVKKDVTKEIEFENALEKSLKEMELLKEKAESANKLKSVFLANISHDIRTPMNAILGFSELLKKQKPNNKMGRYIDNIIISGKILLNLINDILDLSKIEAGQMEIVNSTFFLKDFLKNIKSIFVQQFKQKKIGFKINISNNTPDKLFTDQLRLQQILINFLSNALKFTLKGEVRLKINYNSKEDFIAFEVKDTGVGIPKKNQSKLFSPFFSNAVSPSINEFSTGLGLAICKNLSSLLGGTINMKSELGKGSVFILNIPINSDKVEDITKEKNIQIETVEESINDYSEKKILIADDNQINTELLSEVLLSKGFKNIFIAVDGKEAVEIALKKNPEIIIMDNKMPKKSGLEAFKSLREKKFTNPIILLSADPIEELEGKERKIKPDSYLIKPIDFKLLFDEIFRLLKLKKQIDNSMLITNDLSDKLKRVFIKDLKEKYDYIRKIVNEKKIEENYEDLIRITHTYKGNTKYFGLSDFEELSVYVNNKLNEKINDREVYGLLSEYLTMMNEIIKSNINS